MAAGTILERNLRRLLLAADRALVDERISRRHGPLQALDPRTKLLALLAVAVGIGWIQKPIAVWSLAAGAAVVALLARIPLADLALRAWSGLLVFALAISLPALFLTPGEPLWTAPGLGWVATVQGFRTVALLVGRVELVGTVSALLVLTTPWNRILKALRLLRVPVLVVMIINMAMRYIFLLLRTAQQMFEARLSRMVGGSNIHVQRGMILSGAGVLMAKSSRLGEQVYWAMLARGFAGEVLVLDQFHWRTRDFLALAGVLAAVLAGVWWGR